MSVAVSSSINLLNYNDSQLSGIDVITRDNYQSTIVGYFAGTMVNKPNNVIVGYEAMSKSKNSAGNVAIGFGSATSLQGDDNVLIGTHVNEKVPTGNKNTLLGANTAIYSRGDRNILIGYQNSMSNDSYSSNNIGIGVESDTIGIENVNIGYTNIVEGNKSIALGNYIGNFNNNNILVGHRIANFGSNVLIIKNNQSNVFVNTSNNYTNINDLLFGNNNYLSLASSNINLKGDVLINGSNLQTTLSNFQTNSLSVSNTTNLNGDFFYHGSNFQDILNSIVNSNNFSVNTININSNIFYNGSNLLDIILNNNIVIDSNNFILNNVTFNSNTNLNGDVFYNGSNLKDYLVNNSSTGINSNDFRVNNVTINSNAILNGTVYYNGSNLQDIFNDLIDSNDFRVHNVTINSNANLNGTVYYNGSNLQDIFNNLIDSNDFRVHNVTINSNANLNGIVLYNGSNLQDIFNDLIDSNDFRVNNVTINSNANLNGTVYYNGSNLQDIFNDLIDSNDFRVHNVTINSNANLNGTVYYNGSNLQDIFNDLIDSNDFRVHNVTINSNANLNGTVYYNGSNLQDIFNDLIDSNDFRVNTLTVHSNTYIEGNMTFCNTFINGVLTLGYGNDYIAYSNIPDSFYTEFDSTVVIDSNLYVGGRIFCNGLTWSAKDKTTFNDITVSGTMTLCNTIIDGILTIGNKDNYVTYSNIPDSFYTEFDSTVVVDSNLYVGGRIFCNGLTWSSKDNAELNDAVFYGTATFCNTIIEGILTIGNTNDYVTYSNIPDSFYTEFDSTVVVDSNLYVGGRIFCNGLTWTSKENAELNDAVFYGTATFCNTILTGILQDTYLEGTLSLGKISGGNLDYLSFSNIPNEVISTLDGAAHVLEDLYVGGRIFCNGFTFSSCNINTYECETLKVTSKALFSSDTGAQWSLSVNNNDDFMFSSLNNTHVLFTDSFTSEVLNFTGKHRCTPHHSWNIEKETNLIGKIVVSTGKYKDLDGTDKISIDEAIPIVSLCKRKCDSRAFGVISGFEKTGESHRTFKIGNLAFEHEKLCTDYRVILNSLGEGGIYVCNINGNFANGDLITTSEVDGLGAKQKCNNIKSFTVGKITCDCDFDLNSDIYECSEFIYDGIVYKQAFVGCTYKF